MRILCPRFVAACIMDGVWHFPRCGTVPDIYRRMDKGECSSSSMMRSARARGESEGEAGSFRSHCSRFSQVRCRLAYCRVARASWPWQFSREISPRSMLRINARPGCVPLWRSMGRGKPFPPRPPPASCVRHGGLFFRPVQEHPC